MTAKERFEKLKPDKLTPKENYLRLAHGEDIEYIPTHTFFSMPIHDERPITPMGPCTMLYREDFKPGALTFHDDWGVEYITVRSANGGFIPTGTHTGKYLISDIYKWREQIDTPRLYDGIDWKEKAREDLSKVDRSKTAIVNGSPVMPFQQIMAMMGFNEGLMAMYDEPEIIHDIMNYMMDYLIPHMEACMDAYEPDLFYILDDTATQRAPFISMDMFEEMVLPYYIRMTRLCRERGVPVVYHNCGKCESFLPHMIKDVGVQYWDPAQPVNDLHEIQATLGKEYNFNIIGGFTWKEPDNWAEIVCSWPNLPPQKMDDLEEYVRQQMRDNIDKYAPGGHFLPCAAIIGELGDPLTAQINAWLADESYLYRREWMKKNG